MKEELETALAEIGIPSRNNSLCWTRKLPDEALELLYAIEKMHRDGKIVNKRVAAEKFNELFSITINAGMVERHFKANHKGCICWRERDYL